MTSATKSRRLGAYSPFVHAKCGDCGYSTRTLPGRMHWVDGVGAVQRRCLRCQRVGWYLRQADGGAFVVWTWPVAPHPTHVGAKRECAFKGCPFERPYGDRYCYGHDKQKDRYGVGGMKPLDMDYVRRNRLSAMRRRKP